MFHLDIFKKKFIEELWNEIPEWLSMLVIFASNLFGSHSAGKQLMRLFFRKDSKSELRNYRLVCSISGHFNKISNKE